MKARKLPADYWEQQKKQQIEEFANGWNWERVFRAWSYRLNDFCATLDPLFQPILVHDPANPRGREPKLSWWPTKSIRALHENCQRHLDHWPNTVGLVHPSTYDTRQGEIDTLHYLWENKDNQEKVAAILFAGSLFPRMGSSRARYPDNWPKRWCVKILADWAYVTWTGSRCPSMWHLSCTDVLPVVNQDYIYKLDTVNALVRYLAEEHASLLLQYRPVVIEYGPNRDPFIARTLQKEYQAEKEQQVELEKRWKQEKAEEEQRREKLRREHPRWGDWPSISDAELEQLVWSKPTTQIAKEFGISDVAIGKRCKNAGIPKPKPGFWRKVEAGQLPHPNGRPTNQDH